MRLFDNRVLITIFEPKRYEVAEIWRKQLNEEIHNFYSSRSVSRMMKSRRMIQHTLERLEMCTEFWPELEGQMTTLKI